MGNHLKIKIRGLYKSFYNNKVLQGLNLDIEESKSLVILGSSGSGKSVLIKTIIGLMKPDRGSIIIDNIETSNMSSKEIFTHIGKYGFLFQSSALFDSLTVQDNIVFGVIKTTKLSPKEQRDLAASKLKSVGLSPDICHLYPSELSGGMQKRVSLARAIASNPKIIFFDEPTTGLDPIMANVINELIIKVKSELKATTVTITHDIHSTNMIADRIAFIYHGEILWNGTKDELDSSDNPYLNQFINGQITGPISFA